MSRLTSEQLLERVCADGDETSAHALLSAFFGGFPVERLREVLYSENDDAVRAGAWLASELGSKVAPLVSDLALLLKHPSRYVRFFTVDAVLTGATEQEGDAIAKAVELLEDGDAAVRWKATNFLARASSSQLRSSLPYLKNHLMRTVEDVLAMDAASNATMTRELLENEREGARRLGLIVALRGSVRDPTLLLLAAESKHADVYEIAREWLSQMRARRA